MTAPILLQSIVAWLRKGYPEGIPPYDYVPLFALMQRRLPDDEVRELARELASISGDEVSMTIADAIERLTHEQPSADAIDRVRVRLRDVGWDPQAESVARS
jgi:hypothetical protein